VTRRRASATDVTLLLQSHDDRFRMAVPWPDGALWFDDEVWEAIVARVSLLPRAQAVRLSFVMPAADAPRAGHAADAVRLHFARRRERAEHELRRALHAGWVSLVIGGLLLVALLSLAQGIGGLAPANRLAAALQEGLTIVAWVAMWRPAELLLYSPWSFRRDITLYRRLEEAEVRVVDLAQETTEAAGRRP
jgi:hypothetical protein